MRWKRVNIKFMKMNIWRGPCIWGEKRIDIMIKISMLHLFFLFPKKWRTGKFFTTTHRLLEELNSFVWSSKKLGFLMQNQWKPTRRPEIRSWTINSEVFRSCSLLSWNEVDQPTGSWFSSVVFCIKKPECKNNFNQ